MFLFDAWASALYRGRNERRKEGRKAGSWEGNREERKEAAWKESSQSVNGYSYPHPFPRLTTTITRSSSYLRVTVTRTIVLD